MSATATMNGKPQRKQLADQLDRLDGIIDALAEGLNQAVIDAAREGTRLAVKDAIVEILTDPALRAKLLQAAALEPVAAPVAAEPKPSFWTRLKTAASNTLSSLGQKITAFIRPGIQVAAVAVAALRGPLQLMRWIGSLKGLLTLGTSAGLVVALVNFVAPHVVSATLSGVAGGVAAMAVQAALWTRRAVYALTLA